MCYARLQVKCRSCLPKRTPRGKLNSTSRRVEARSVTSASISISELPPLLPPSFYLSHHNITKLGSTVWGVHFITHVAKQNKTRPLLKSTSHNSLISEASLLATKSSPLSTPSSSPSAVEAIHASKTPPSETRSKEPHPCIDVPILLRSIYNQADFSTFTTTWTATAISR